MALDKTALAAAVRANTAETVVEHVVVALPSFSLGESLLAHYGDRLPALEQRFLLGALMTHRLPHAEFVFVGSTRPDPYVLEYYRRLGPRPDVFARRVHLVSVDDDTPAAVAGKLLQRPDLLRRLRALLAGRFGVLESWNVTEAEMELAESLGIPINGTSPSLRHLGYKSEGRRILRGAGVPVPSGVEDVKTIDDVIDAVTTVRRARPQLREVVVKHDDSGAGDGNAIISVTDETGRPASPDVLRDRLNQLPDWYLQDLKAGGVVEERISGQMFASPSAQIDILPDGKVAVLASHEQQLGGDSGQVFTGCEFPADPEYAHTLADYAAAVGAELATLGALGRMAVDFVAVRDHDGPWSLYGLEMNLRRGGTTHPYAVLRNLVPGHYEERAGRWVAESDGGARSYLCSEALAKPQWRGLSPRRVIDAVRDAGVEFDHRTGTGIVLHSLTGLDIDGRIGFTSIGMEAHDAQSGQEDLRQVMDRLASAS
jgi:hypothetical protein